MIFVHLRPVGPRGSAKFHSLSTPFIHDRLQISLRSLPLIHIIGRGIAGLSLAYELVRRGRQVVLVGPKQRPGSATQAAVGVASVKGNIQGNSELFRCKLQAQSALPAWLRRLEQDSRVPIERLSGSLELFESVQGYEAIRNRVFHRLFTGCFDMKVLPRKDLTNVFHNLERLCPGSRGAFLYPSDLWVNPEHVLLALESFLAQNGVTAIDATVTRINFKENQRPVLELELEHTSLPFEEVVLAAGAFAHELLLTSDLPGLTKLPLEAVAGETLEGPAPTDMHGVINRGRVNLVVAKGRYLYGSSSRVVKAASDAGPSSLFVQQLHSDLQRFAPLPNCEGVRWGLRTRVKDQSPVIGPLFWSKNERPLWVYLALYKNGLQLAPWLSQRLAAAINGENDSHLPIPSAFSPNRF